MRDTRGLVEDVISRQALVDALAEKGKGMGMKSVTRRMKNRRRVEDRRTAIPRPIRHSDARRVNVMATQDTSR